MYRQVVDEVREKPTIEFREMPVTVVKHVACNVNNLHCCTGTHGGAIYSRKTKSCACESAQTRIQSVYESIRSSCQARMVENGKGGIVLLINNIGLGTSGSA